MRYFKFSMIGYRTPIGEKSCDFTEIEIDISEYTLKSMIANCGRGKTFPQVDIESVELISMTPEFQGRKKS